MTTNEETIEVTVSPEDEAKFVEAQAQILMHFRSFFPSEGVHFFDIAFARLEVSRLNAVVIALNGSNEELTRRNEELSKQVEVLDAIKPTTNGSQPD